MRKLLFLLLLFIVANVPAQNNTPKGCDIPKASFELCLKAGNPTSGGVRIYYVNEDFDEERIKNTTFDNKGCCKFEVPVFDTFASVTLSIEGNWYNLLLCAGDTLSVIYDLATQRIEFFGNNVRWQQELDEYNRFVKSKLKYLDPMNYNTQQVFLEACMENWKSRLALLNEFLNENTLISSEVCKYIRGEHAAVLFSWLTQYATD